MALQIAAALCILLTLGCGDDTASTPADGGVLGDALPEVDGGVFGDPEVRPPAAPRLRCLAGWHERTDDAGNVYCDPYDENGPMECPVGEAHFPGTTGCEPLGDPCPEGDFREGIPDQDGTRFVRPGAEGGDGTRDRPFGTLRQAVSAQARTIILAKGTFDENVTIPRSTTFIGACAAETNFQGEILDQSLSGSLQTGLVLRNLRIGRVSARNQLGLHGVQVRRSMNLPRYVSVKRVVLGDPADPRWNEFIGTSHTRFEIEDSIVHGQLAVGAILGQLYDPDPDYVGAITSSVRMNNVVIVGRGHQPVGNLPRCFGALAADVTATGVTFDSCWGGGFQAAGGSHALRHLLLRAIVPADDGLEGRAIAIRDGDLQASGIFADGAYDFGVYVARTPFDIRDLTVRSVEAEHATGRLGGGIAVVSSRGELERVRVEQVQSLGLFVDGESDVRATDLRVSDVGAEPVSHEYGRAVSVQGGAVLDLERVALSNLAEFGLHANAAVVGVRDLAVDGLSGRPGDGFGGGGLVVQAGARVVADSVKIENARGVAVYGIHQGELELSDVRIGHVLPFACAATTCPAAGLGMGVGSYVGSRLDLDGFSIADAALCGIHVAVTGELDARRGSVRDVEVGACIETEDYDLARITQDVAYSGRSSTLEYRSLPVPAAAATLDEVAGVRDP